MPSRGGNANPKSDAVSLAACRLPRAYVSFPSLLILVLPRSAPSETRFGTLARTKCVLDKRAGQVAGFSIERRPIQSSRSRISDLEFVCTSTRQMRPWIRSRSHVAPPPGPWSSQLGGWMRLARPGFRGTLPLRPLCLGRSAAVLHVYIMVMSGCFISTQHPACTARTDWAGGCPLPARGIACRASTYRLFDVASSLGLPSLLRPCYRGKLSVSNVEIESVPDLVQGLQFKARAQGIRRSISFGLCSFSGYRIITLSRSSCQSTSYFSV